MHIVDDSEVNRVLTFPILIEAIEAAHRRPKIAVRDGYLGDDKGQQLVTRSAVDAGRFMMTKLYTSFPGNLAHSKLPAVQAVCVLFDGNDGRPLAVMDAAEITHWKTAADSALGAKHLARPDAARLLESDGIATDVATDLDAATREADIITTCTRSREPLVKGANLRPGTHLDLVGGFTPETRESDDEAARRARIFVDRRESAFDGVGDILQPIKSGAIKESDVLGDHYDLAGGKVAGRQSADDITFFKNAGGGHLDLMTCETVFEQLGKELR